MCSSDLQSNYLKFRTTKIHYRKEINNIKIIDLSWPKDKIERYIRATYMLGFEPPYCFVGEKKVYFNLDNS